MSRFILIAALNTIFHVGLGQSQYRFRHFDSRDGLGFDQANSVYQDSLGFIWISSTSGVSRYDGYNFKVYKFDPADSLNSPGSEWIDGTWFDAKGNLCVIRSHWMSVDNKYSIMRYERKTDSFRKIKPPVNDAIINSFSFDVKNDSIIWLSGVGGSGLFRYNYLTNEIKNYRIRHHDESLQRDRNNIIYAHDYGRFLLMTTEGGTWRFDKATEKFSRPKCDPQDSSLFYAPSLSFIFPKPDPSDYNNLWIVYIGTKIIGTELFASGMVKIDSNFHITKRFKFPYGFKLQSMDSGPDGVIWIVGIDGELLRYDPADNSVKHIRHREGDPYSLPDAGLTNIFIDRDQNIWVTTGKGVSMMKKQDFAFYNYSVYKSPAIEVYQANGKDFVVVAKTIPGVNTPESTNEIHAAAIRPSHLDSLNFQKIELQQPIIKRVDPDGNTQIDFKGDVYDLEKGKNYLWIGSSGSGVTGLRIDPKTGMLDGTAPKRLRHQPDNINSISSDFLHGIHEENGSLWLATASAAGVNRVRLDVPYGQEGSVTRFTHDLRDSNSVGSNLVFRFFPGDDGDLWVNHKSGMDLFRDNKFLHVSHASTQVYSIFKSHDGITYLGTTDGLYASRLKDYPYQFERDPMLKNYEVLGIAEDKLNRLWFSNFQGTLMYDPKEKLLIEFTEEDGIQYSHENMEETSQGYLITTDGSGISLFDPSALVVNRNKTFPVLTKLMVNNQQPTLGNRTSSQGDFVIDRDVTVLEELVIDYKHNNFGVEFSAMQMIDPKRNLYQYRLEGYDKEWIQTDWKNRTATYTNLDAGSYTLRVKASNHHGVWSNQERTLAITVLPPPWKTTWAYLGYGLVIVGTLFLARRGIIQRERLKSRLKLEHLELEKAKEVDRMKTTFFTNISHEFRTPLTLIKGPAQNLLAEFSSRPTVKKQVNLIQHNADLLLKLINQLLDLAKLEAGTIEVKASEGDLNSFLNVVIDSFTSRVREKGIDFIYNLPDIRYRVSFDKDKIETIITNLLGNALKFTPSHCRVDFDAKVNLSESSNVGQLVISVSDTGIGIPIEDQAKIFERFYQVNEGGAHKEAGSGIGLALVKQLTELLHGNVKVKSEPGKGSEFCVTLPVQITGVADEVESLEPQETAEIYSEPEGDVISEGSGKTKLLVVEDNAELRSFIVSSFDGDYSFCEAGDGKEAIEIALQEAPELIISDVMMPEMDGIAMTAKLKKDIRTSHIPIILLTAKATNEAKITGLNTGADDYLVKPFNHDELILKVRNMIESRNKVREKVRLEFMREGPSVEAISADEKLLQKVKAAILKRLSDEQLSVDSLADEIGLSRTHFYRKVTALTGLPVNELIRSFRLERAAQLLAQNWGPVSQVAYEVGFSNPSYFSKRFRDKFGVLPSEYHLKDQVH